jgi:ABC-type multidrug transport system fused ATPase/permease subunit
MRLFWIFLLLLPFASFASLVSGGQSRELSGETWERAAEVLPEQTLAKMGSLSPAYTARAFQWVPLPLRKKLASKMWNAIELITFRSLLVWHLVPTFVVAILIGLLEGFWGRSNQKSVVKIHSPMQFSLALFGLSLSPILILLWVAAPMTLPVSLLLLCIFGIATFSIHNLIVHAPTQF